MNDRAQFTQPPFVPYLVLLSYLVTVGLVAWGIHDATVRHEMDGMYWLAVAIVLLPVAAHAYSYLFGDDRDDDPQQRLSDYEDAEQ